MFFQIHSLQLSISCMDNQIFVANLNCVIIKVNHFLYFYIILLYSIPSCLCIMSLCVSYAFIFVESILCISFIIVSTQQNLINFFSDHIMLVNSNYFLRLLIYCLIWVLFCFFLCYLHQVYFFSVFFFFFFFSSWFTSRQFCKFSNLRFRFMTHCFVSFAFFHHYQPLNRYIFLISMRQSLS